MGDVAMSDAGAKFWTLAEIEARLEEAAKTLVALKLTIRDIPSRQMVRWPEVVRGSLDAFGFTPQRPRVAAPTPGAIDRADETVAWLLWMEAEQRRCHLCTRNAECHAAISARPRRASRSSH